MLSADARLQHSLLYVMQSATLLDMTPGKRSVFAMVLLMTPVTPAVGCFLCSAAMSMLDPQQAAVLGNAGVQLQQADEAAVTAVTVALRNLQDLERLIREASSPDVRDG